MNLETYSDRGNELCEQYKECFKDHVASVIEFEGNQIINWRRPGEVNYSMKIICSGANIFISGDLGEAVYWCTWKTSWQNIADKNFGYLLGKLQCVTYGKKDYQQDQCIKDIEEWYQEQMNEYNEYPDGFIDGYKSNLNDFRQRAMWHTESKWTWIPFLQDYDLESIGEDFDTVMWKFGEQINSRLYGYWVAFHMIKEQLENKNL